MATHYPKSARGELFFDNVPLSFKFELGLLWGAKEVTDILGMKAGFNREVWSSGLNFFMFRAMFVLAILFTILTSLSQPDAY